MAFASKIVINYLHDLAEENTKRTQFLYYFLDKMPSRITSVLNLYDFHDSNHNTSLKSDSRTRHFDVNRERKNYEKIWLWEIPEWNKMTHLKPLSMCKIPDLLSWLQWEPALSLNRRLHRSHTVFCAQHLFLNIPYKFLKIKMVEIIMAEKKGINNWLYLKRFC